MKTAFRNLSVVSTVAVLWTAAVFHAAALDTINFDTAKAGELPANWIGTNTGKGNPKWVVATDNTAPSKPNVLKQSGEGTYPLALKNDSSLKDGYVEVKFKAVSGEKDQAAGVVWRAKDADNFYIARANALEENVRIYHFVNGKRTQFKGEDLPVPANQWHTLRVNFTGNRFTVVFNGKELFSAEDETLKDAGKVGLWTKADSVTLFDDFSFGAK